MISREKEHQERVRALMKERRISLKLKQIDAAKRSGVNVRTLQHFEQTGEIHFFNLLKLLILYDLDRRVVDCILDRSGWTLEEIERAEKRKKVR